MTFLDRISLTCVHRFPGGKGRGVRVLVVDHTGYDSGHPALRDVKSLAKLVSHGSRSLGIAKLLAPEAEVAHAITLLMPTRDRLWLRPGDVCCVVRQGYLLEPIEYSTAHREWCDAIRGFVDRSVTVLIPSGNGALDLGLLEHVNGDTGAVMVGGCAQEPPVWDRSACYGERVDCTAPTAGVPTVDGLFTSGTSAAVCVVAAVAACLQGITVAEYSQHYPIEPPTMRKLLRASRRQAGMVDAETYLKRLVGYPDYDRDGRVGMWDVVQWGRQVRPRRPDFLELLRCYAGKRRWPEDWLCGSTSRHNS